MNLNTKTNCGVVSFYEAPSIQMLACSSEGVLCQSGYTWTEGGAGSYDEGSINDNGEY